jgi:hypothetical protein
VAGPPTRPFLFFFYGFGDFFTGRFMPGAYTGKKDFGMDRIKKISRRILIGLPLVGIVGAAFIPLQAWAQQALVLFTLLWFYVFVLFEVMGG